MKSNNGHTNLKPSGAKKRMGAGLSLERFSKAKQSGYDPRQEREKERVRAAKTVNKYKRLKKRLLPEEDQARDNVEQANDHAGHHDKDTTAADAREPSATFYQRQEQRRQKHVPSLERLAAKVQIEQEAERQQREEKQRQLDEKRQKLEGSMKKRKEENKVFRKKTKTGQPVMKYRIEKMLEKLV